MSENTKADINEFIDSKEDAKFDMKVSNGAFKVISGAVGKLNPDKFKLSTKTATIGIRGTYFFGNVQDYNEKIGCTLGSIFVKI